MPGQRIAIASLIGVAALAGCGGSVRSAAPSAQQISQAFAGSPAPLAALHAQANKLLNGDPAGFKARLASLRGYPIVVNKWAAWCVPCRAEIPLFQQAAVTVGRQVAFVGLDVADNRDAAQSFLQRYPLTYPQYTDPDTRINQALNASGFTPATLFYDRAGKRAYIHLGQYRTLAQLLADVHRYLGV
jgi:cytochrome c biogenesis protein CcmG/thiol:disulfide interchange protein DsbE